MAMHIEQVGVDEMEVPNRYVEITYLTPNKVIKVAYLNGEPDGMIGYAAKVTQIEMDHVKIETAGTEFFLELGPTVKWLEPEEVDFSDWPIG